MRRRATALAALSAVLFFSSCASVVQAMKNRPCELDPARPFTSVEVGPGEELRLYRLDPATGEPFRTLGAVRRHVEASGERLVMATNAGIFEPGLVPTGLYVEDGVEQTSLNAADGVGNFFLKPNGVFFVAEDGRTGIVATEEWQAMAVDARLATQSGPLLLREGRVHPAFRETSENCRVRSGVGVRPNGAVVFAISNGAVSFHDFATHFRDALGAPDALYLDGGISRMLVPGEREEEGEFAAVLAVVAPAEAPMEEGERP